LVLVILGWFGLDWFLSLLDGLGLIGSCHSWMAWAWMVLVILGWFGLGWFLSFLDGWAWIVLVILGWFLSFLDGLGLIGCCHSWMVWAWMVLVILGWFRLG
jgi:hypothetical protein